MTLDTFNRHPEKVGIACCAQLINCLSSLYLAHENKFCVTPVGHVFQMYAPHQGARSGRAEFSAPSIHYDRDGMPASFWGLNGSASLLEKSLVLTAVNPDVSHDLEAGIMIRGAQPKSAQAAVLTAPDIHAHNTFEQCQAVLPRIEELEVRGPNLNFRFPAASVVKLEKQLAWS